MGTGVGRATGVLFAITVPFTAMLGCAVTQPQDAPAPEIVGSEPRTGREYSLYVPAGYDAGRKWPLVITLHGTFLFDGHRDQIREWKMLAEENGFIAAAPRLRSTQGILPRIGSLWYEDLAADEKTILALLDLLEARYAIDANNVLLTGFSSGGYPMYWTGLRNPGQFSMLVARAGNCDTGMLDRIRLGPGAQKLPVAMIYGTTDLWMLRNQTFEAYEYLTQHGVPASIKPVGGGHWRHPEVACALWRARCWQAAPPAHKAFDVDALIPLEAPPAKSTPVAKPRATPTPQTPRALSRPAEQAGRKYVTPSAGDVAPTRWHTIRRGETYWSLAERYFGSGRRWKEIADANPALNSSGLRVGQRVAIPKRGQ